MMKRSWFALGLVLAIAAPIASPAAVPACDGTGSSWSSYGRDAHNTRNGASAITAANATSLTATLQIPTGGTVQNTPVLAQGCIFLASELGELVAHKLDGERVWGYAPQGPFGLGGGFVGSPLYHQGRLYAAVNRRSAPTLAVLDAASGAILKETLLDSWGGNFASASPVLAGNRIFVGISGDEASSTARGGYAFTDLDGNLDEFRYTITDAEYAAGFRGASVWTSGAYDASLQAVFVGGGNPASKKIEHRYSNALLKIDANPYSETYAEIVDAYKGNSDQYYPGLDRQPACDAFGDSLVVVWSLACLQLDLDFGASPNLWTDEATGRVVLGDLQKSGIYHAVWADNMQAFYTAVAGAPCAVCNAASGATDATNVYAVGTPGGVLQAFTKAGGKFRWATPTADGAHFGSVSVTNDVVLTITTTGLVMAFNASNGAPLFAGGRQSGSGLALTTNIFVGLTSAGIAIDGDSIWAPLGNAVVRFQLS